jgi:polyhydroxyalkanoate synthase subunit PhaC
MPQETNKYRRLLPRPLALHFATAVNTWCGGVAALPTALEGQFHWHPDVAENARELIEGALTSKEDGEISLYQAVAEEAMSRLGDMAEGILAYQAHPYRRSLPDARVVWQEGTTRILDYGGTSDLQAPSVPTVLFVPSLVNRAYILDLSERRSLVRYFSSCGFRPLLLDWGAPGATERQFALSDYIDGRLNRGLDRALELAEGPVGMTGYCMGGDLILPLVQRRPEDVVAAAFLATPWDFHADRGLPEQMLPLIASLLSPALEQMGELPVDCLQTFFASLNPNLAGSKFRRFRHMDQESAAASDFVALEDWLNDGVPVVGRVARECLTEWYQHNATAQGKWLIAGDLVAPDKITVPSLVAAPTTDRLVRPGSAQALADAIPNSDILTPPSGHIGMVAGNRAQQGLWEPLERWFAGNMK